MKAKIKRLEGEAMHSQQDCANCGTEEKCRRRDFSEQAWTVLLLWNEVDKSAVDQPICQPCYDELREVLIDRADEIEAAFRQLTPGAKAPKTSRKRVREAS